MNKKISKENIKNISFILPQNKGQYNSNLHKYLYKNKKNKKSSSSFRIKNKYTSIYSYKDLEYTDRHWVSSKYKIKKINKVNYYNQFETSNYYKKIKNNYLNSCTNSNYKKNIKKIKKKNEEIKLHQQNKEINTIINDIKFNFIDKNVYLYKDFFGNCNKNYYFERIITRKKFVNQIEKLKLSYNKKFFHNNYHPGAFSNCSNITNENNIYILKDEKLWILDLEFLKWISIKFKNSKIFNIYNSSLIYYKSNFFLFFGKNKYDGELNNKIIMFNFLNKEIKYLNEYNKKPLPRIYQFCIKIKNYIYFMGGQNTELYLFDDIWKFDILSNKWTNLNKNDPLSLFDGIFGINGFLLKDNDINLNKIITNNTMFSKRTFFNNIIMDDTKIQILLFGGFIDIKNSTNNLIQADINSNNINFKKIKTLGQKPIARGFHCFEYIENFNLAILYGGRNENILDFNLKYTIKDFWVLCLKSWTWINIPDKYIPLPDSYGMVSIYSNNELYIFGGSNDNSFNEMVLHNININN